VAPWTLRNWVRFDALVPVSTMGGRALWEGNTLGDRGQLYAEHDRISREEGQVAAYRHAVREGLRSIRERQPRWILDKAVHELDGLFTPIEMVLVHLQKGGYGPPSLRAAWVVAAVTVPPYLAAMTLFIFGLARIRRTRARAILLLFFAFYVLLHVVVHGHHRFRLALLPVVFTVGASALFGLPGEAAPWTRARRLLAAALLLAFAVSVVRAVSGLPRDPAFREVSVGATARVGAGEGVGARRRLHGVEAEGPQHVPGRHRPSVFVALPALRCGLVLPPRIARTRACVFPGCPA
jgi:hypothetical protein